LKDEEAIDWREGFRSLKGSKGTSSRRFTKARGVCCVEKGERKGMNV
jgi:hypothetical protein